ncbi:MAG: hypothetical protein HN356_04345 [Calditrichaeota bacterium]|jgi:hypothetical protein|nr:hypothetical protein [Calditrichota bacterium]MBT7617369.1 hypothetical protein [Calditrichota bacterium]MBT7790413.1 hypothetical protein [Calditrichota bacterium]
MFGFLEFIGHISLFGLEIKYPREVSRAYLFVLVLLVIGLIIVAMIYTGGSVSHSDVESEIKLIDEAIAKFFKEQFTLPSDVDQLIDFAYIEKDNKVWKKWEFSLERDASSITRINAVSTKYTKETIHFDCIDKVFEK